MRIRIITIKIIIITIIAMRISMVAMSFVIESIIFPRFVIGELAGKEKKSCNRAVRSATSCGENCPRIMFKMGDHSELTKKRFF